MIERKEDLLAAIEGKDKDIKKNVLLGNGFCLAHPVLGGCFKWDMHQALCDSWPQMLPKKSKGCPEKDLQDIRLSISEKILQYYMDRLFGGINIEDKNFKGLFQTYKDNCKWSCSKFLKSLNAQNIFTVNYDPLLYFEILGLLLAQKQKRNFCDGFITEDVEFLKQDLIIDNLKKTEKTKILFLHGSWFIQANENDDLRKVSFGKDSPEVAPKCWTVWQQK